jgi:hypothetical protein
VILRLAELRDVASLTGGAGPVEGVRYQDVPVPLDVEDTARYARRTVSLLEATGCHHSEALRSRVVDGARSNVKSVEPMKPASVAQQHVGQATQALVMPLEQRDDMIVPAGVASRHGHQCPMHQYIDARNRPQVARDVRFQSELAVSWVLSAGAAGAG